MLLWVHTAFRPFEVLVVGEAALENECGPRSGARAQFHERRLHALLGERREMSVGIHAPSLTENRRTLHRIPGRPETKRKAGQAVDPQCWYARRKGTP